MTQNSRQSHDQDHGGLETALRIALIERADDVVVPSTLRARIDERIDGPTARRFGLRAPSPALQFGAAAGAIVLAAVLAVALLPSGVSLSPDGGPAVDEQPTETADPVSPLPIRTEDPTGPVTAAELTSPADGELDLRGRWGEEVLVRGVIAEGQQLSVQLVMDDGVLVVQPSAEPETAIFDLVVDGEPGIDGMREAALLIEGIDTSVLMVITGVMPTSAEFSFTLVLEPVGEIAEATEAASDVSPTASPGEGHTTYVVRRGDTLSGIAEAVYGNPACFGLIAEANGITDANPLFVSMQLTIPPIDRCHAGSSDGEPQ